MSVEGTDTYCGGVCGDNNKKVTYCYWGGGSSAQDDAVGRGAATATEAETYKFGDGTNNTAWPSSNLPGWGDSAADGWDAASLGAWTNPWESLGGWNGGSPSYPTLKSPD